MQPTRSRLSGALGTAILLPLIVACSESGGDIGGPVLSETGLIPASVWVCKRGPEGTSADFRITADGPGTLPLGSEFTINAYPDQCIEGVNRFDVWVAQSPRPDPLENTVLTVEEVGASEGMELTLIDYVQFSDWISQYAYPPTTSATITVNYDDGGRFKFFNEGAPPPPAGQGCTPGYWKQPHHFDSWVGYSPDDSFAEIFGRDAFPGFSLLDVLMLKGGGLRALGRHAVAGLLSASSSDVDYGATAADVIAMFQSAYDSGNYEQQKDQFDEWNNRGCSLD